MVDCYIQKYWECEIGWHLSSNWMKKQNKTNMLKSVSIHFDCFTLNNGPYRRHKSLKTLHKYKANTAVMTYSTYLQPTWKNKSQLQIFIMNTYSMNNEILKSTGEVQSLRQKLILRQKITNIQIPWSLTLVHHREIIKIEHMNGNIETVLSKRHEHKRAAVFLWTSHIEEWHTDNTRGRQGLAAELEGWRKRDGRIQTS